MPEVTYHSVRGALYGLHQSKASQAKVRHWICVIDIVVIVLFVLTGAGYYTLYDNKAGSASNTGIGSQVLRQIAPIDVPISNKKLKGSSLLNPYRHEGFYGYHGFKVIAEQQPQQISSDIPPTEKPTFFTRNLLPSPDVFELPSGNDAPGFDGNTEHTFGYADGSDIGWFGGDSLYIADEFVHSEFDAEPKLLTRELQWLRPAKPLYPPVPLQAHIECQALVVVYVDENGIFTALPDSISGERRTMEYELDGMKRQLEYACRMVYFIKDGESQKRTDTLNSEQAMKYMTDFYREFPGDSYNFYEPGYSIDADFARALILSLIQRGNRPAVVDGKAVGTIVAVSWNFEILVNELEWLRAEFMRVQYQTQ